MSVSVKNECRACDGNGWWMAPVYHNERVRETCARCGGTGAEPKKAKGK
jgi:DnaJ-class molecular chaperone